MTVPSDRNAHRMKKFISGLTLGAFTALAGGMAAVYVLNMTQVVAVSIVSVPDIHQTLAWAYDNLRLSVIPFFLVLMIFCRDLVILRRQLAQSTISLTAICQRESFIDMWIKIFFGIGVIWTAIGLRNALLEGVGGLDASAAAAQGAFVILRRLVDGGILLALSTTIVGGIGGYAMHLTKALVVGKQLQAYYLQSEARQADEVARTLNAMARDLSVLVHPADKVKAADP
jgi:hypothetical protein